MEKEDKRKPPKLIESVDYYFENDLMVLTAHFLKNRDYCCGNGCRHCPYQNQDNQNYNKKTSNSSR